MEKIDVNDNIEKTEQEKSHKRVKLLQQPPGGDQEEGKQLDIEVLQTLTGIPDDSTISQDSEGKTPELKGGVGGGFTDEVYKESCQAQEAGDCQDIPGDAIMDIKANFTLEWARNFVKMEKEETPNDVLDLNNKIAKEKRLVRKKHLTRRTKKFRGNQREYFKVRGSGPFVARGMRGSIRGNMRGCPDGPFARGNMRGNINMRGNGGPWTRGRGGTMGITGIGPSPWSQYRNMDGEGGMGPQGWSLWNQGGGMGGNIGRMGNSIGGGMGNNMGMSGGMSNSMGGDMRGVMDGGMGYMYTNSWNNGGRIGQQRQVNMGIGGMDNCMGGGHMAVNKWGGNQGTGMDGNMGGRMGEYFRGMGRMGLSGGMGINMSGNTRGNMGGGVCGGMGGAGGSMNTYSWSTGGGWGQQRQGSMRMGGCMGGGNMEVNNWGGNQGNHYGGNKGGYLGSHKWGGNQRGSRHIGGRKF